jgi:hypothetical protein
MARLDLNATRAARSEAENQPHEVVLGFDASGAEQVFLVRPRMPLEFPSLLARGMFVEAMEIVLVDPSDWEGRMRATVPEEDDLMAIADLYAVDMGESPASAPSSMNGGQSSRPTSKGSTHSTSAKRATAPKRSGSAASTP